MKKNQVKIRDQNILQRPNTYCDVRLWAFEVFSIDCSWRGLNYYY